MLITCDAIESNALQRDYLQQVIESHFSNSEYIYLIYAYTEIKLQEMHKINNSICYSISYSIYVYVLAVLNDITGTNT